MTVVDLIKIVQVDHKPMFVGKISFKQLYGKERLTKREFSGASEFQRKTDAKRVKDIANFLEDHDATVSPFPTPLVLSVDTETESFLEENEVQEYMKRSSGKAVLINDKGNSDIDRATTDFFKLHLPQLNNNIFIVDGQHRFNGVKEYLRRSKTESDFEFLVTFLLNYDTYEQSKVFANINFKQKPVNKSLYYDIFGSLPGKNQFTFCHYLISNIDEKQEIAGLVKMLGTGKGIVSLAFMVETFMKLISQKGMVYQLYHQYEVSDYDGSAQDYLSLSVILNSYFYYFFVRFPEYTPQKVEKTNYDEPIFSSYKYDYYLFKATGMYGLLFIFNDLFEKGVLTFEDNTEDKVFSKLDDTFGFIINKNYSNRLFNDSRLKGAGSASLQKRFYKKMYLALWGAGEFKNKFGKRK